MSDLPPHTCPMIYNLIRLAQSAEDEAKLNRDVVELDLIEKACADIIYYAEEIREANSTLRAIATENIKACEKLEDQVAEQECTIEDLRHELKLAEAKAISDT